MSEQYKTILKAGNAAISAGNHEGFLDFCTEDTEWNFLGEQTLKGKKAVRDWMAATYLQPPEVTIDHLIAEGEFLTAVGKVTMYDKEGKGASYDYCDVWRFRNGLLASLKAFVIPIASQ